MRKQRSMRISLSPKLYSTMPLNISPQKAPKAPRASCAASPIRPRGRLVEHPERHRHPAKPGRKPRRPHLQRDLQKVVMQMVKLRLNVGRIRQKILVLRRLESHTQRILFQHRGRDLRPENVPPALIIRPLLFQKFQATANLGHERQRDGAQHHGHHDFPAASQPAHNSRREQEREPHAALEVKKKTDRVKSQRHRGQEFSFRRRPGR